MYRFIKRFLDIVLSSLVIIVFGPLLAILALLVRINLGKNVLFKQKRVGRYGKIFTLYKFRSMKTIYDEQGNLLPDEQRLNKFGLLLRRSSLDELPQVFNIFLGQMTIIGPRPKTIEETMLMKDTMFVFRNCVKPGLSSWSVVHGRNNIRTDRALTYDLQYVTKYSFFLDIKILFLTIWIVLKGTGISTDGYVTFQPIRDFLLENNLKSRKEITLLRKEAFDVEIKNLKVVPLGITKEQYKKAKRQIKRLYEGIAIPIEPTWK